MMTSLESDVTVTTLSTSSPGQTFTSSSIYSSDVIMSEVPSAQQKSPRNNNDSGIFEELDASLREIQNGTSAHSKNSIDNLANVNSLDLSALNSSNGLSDKFLCKTESSALSINNTAESNSTNDKNVELGEVNSIENAEILNSELLYENQIVCESIDNSNKIVNPVDNRNQSTGLDSLAEAAFLCSEDFHDSDVICIEDSGQLHSNCTSSEDAGNLNSSLISHEHLNEDILGEKTDGVTCRNIELNPKRKEHCEIVEDLGQSIRVRSCKALISQVEGEVVSDGRRVTLYRCHLCQRLFQNLLKVQCHLSSHNNEESVKRFKCHLCDRSCARKTRLLQHLQWHHKMKLPHAKRICSEGLSGTLLQSLGSANDHIDQGGLGGDVSNYDDGAFSRCAGVEGKISGDRGSQNKIFKSNCRSAEISAVNFSKNNDQAMNLYVGAGDEAMSFATQNSETINSEPLNFGKLNGKHDEDKRLADNNKISASSNVKKLPPRFGPESQKRFIDSSVDKRNQNEMNSGCVMQAEVDETCVVSDLSSRGTDLEIKSSPIRSLLSPRLVNSRKRPLSSENRVRNREMQNYRSDDELMDKPIKKEKDADVVGSALNVLPGSSFLPVDFKDFLPQTDTTMSSLLAAAAAAASGNNAGYLPWPLLSLFLNQSVLASSLLAGSLPQSAASASQLLSPAVLQSLYSGMEGIKYENNPTGMDWFKTTDDSSNNASINLVTKYPEKSTTATESSQLLKSSPASDELVKLTNMALQNSLLTTQQNKIPPLIKQERSSSITSSYSESTGMMNAADLTVRSHHSSPVDSQASSPGSTTSQQDLNSNFNLPGFPAGLTSGMTSLSAAAAISDYISSNSAYLASRGLSTTSSSVSMEAVLNGMDWKGLQKLNEATATKSVTPTKQPASSSSSGDQGVGGGGGGRRKDGYKPVLLTDGQTVYQCTYCGKEFSTVSDVNRHIDIHEDVRPFKCSHCNYYARTNSQLKVHYMRHQGIRKYQCKLCNYKGVTQSDLNRHTKSQVHMLKSRNQCSVCGEGFVSPINLGKHYHERHVNNVIASSTVTTLPYRNQRQRRHGKMILFV